MRLSARRGSSKVFCSTVPSYTCCDEGKDFKQRGKERGGPQSDSISDGEFRDGAVVGCTGKRNHSFAARRERGRLEGRVGEWDEGDLSAYHRWRRELEGSDSAGRRRSRFPCDPGVR